MHDHETESILALENSIQLGSSAFGPLDPVPEFFRGEETEMTDGIFKVIFQTYHVFADASKMALGAVCYSLTHYMSGPPTARLVFAKGRVTPKGKSAAKTIP